MRKRKAISADRAIREFKNLIAMCEQVGPYDFDKIDEILIRSDKFGTVRKNVILQMLKKSTGVPIYVLRERITELR